MSTPRISRLNRNEVDASITQVFDDSLRERGNVPYFFRTLAHRPSIMTTAWAHMQAVLAEGTLPRALKELAVVRTSQLNRTPYCLASHTMMAKKLGCSDEKLDGKQAGAVEFSVEEVDTGAALASGEKAELDPAEALRRKR